MPDAQEAKQEAQKVEGQVKTGAFQSAKAWGDSSLSPALLATLIFPQHVRPFQAIPMLFPPILLGTSYLNLAGYKRDAAGISAAWSALYIVLASRRRHRVMQKFGARGLIRGATLGLGAVNVLAGGVSYVFGERGRSEKWIGKGSE